MCAHISVSTFAGRMKQNKIVISELCGSVALCVALRFFSFFFLLCLVSCCLNNTIMRVHSQTNRQTHELSRHCRTSPKPQILLIFALVEQIIFYSFSLSAWIQFILVVSKTVADCCCALTFLLWLMCRFGVYRVCVCLWWWCSLHAYFCIWLAWEREWV